MLSFGGLIVRNDDYLNIKEALETYRNPYGFFEDERVANRTDGCTKLMSVCMLQGTQGMKLIYLQRSIKEMQSSWDDIYTREMFLGIKTLKRNVTEVVAPDDWDKVFTGRNDILRLEYNAICKDPLMAAKQIADFINTDDFKFNYIKASTAVDSSLYIDRRK
jgi:hypothetical protein